MKTLGSILIIYLMLPLVVKGKPDLLLITGFPSQSANPQMTTEMTAPDTLFPETVKEPGKRILYYRWIGGGIALISGLVANYYYHQAETSYRQYLKTGNIQEMDALISDAKRFDRYSGLSFIGVEAGLILFLISYYD